MTTATATLPDRTLRNGDIPQLISILQSQQAAKLDLVAQADLIHLISGKLALVGQDVVLSEDGVSDPNGVYALTSVAEQNIADLLGIPVRYLRRMLTDKPTLADANVNAWAGEKDGTVLFRILQGANEDDPGTSGIVRAVLSSKYNLSYDNLDTVMSVLQGMRAAGLDGSNITGVDLSDQRLYISVDVPQIAIDAGKLVENYRSPYLPGVSGKDMPLLNAGLVFTNSEVGRGAFQILPKAVLQVCKNGLTRAVDGFRKVHLGGRLQEGTITWSAETQNAANEFVRAQVKDAVASFLSEGYLENLRDDLLRDAGVEIADVTKTLEVVGKKLQYSQTEQDMILADFIRGGQVTSGGVLNAVTSVAQRIEDPDRAFDFNLSAIDAMKVAARVAVSA